MVSRPSRALALAAAFATVAAPGRADEPTAAEIGAARQLGIEGVKLANAGKCAEAIDRLGRAERLHHAPTILVRLGECQIAVGKIVEGTENLQRVVREPLAPGAPAPFVAAKQRAEKALEASIGKIAKLTIDVTAPAGASPSVTVDGAPVPPAMLGAERPTDPGDHVVEATAPGFLPAKKSVSLEPGGSGRVALTLEPDPAAKHVEAPASASAPETPTGPPETSTTRSIGYVSLGIGGAGVVIGGVVGALVLSKRKTLDADCPDKVCPPSKQGELDSAHTMATVSTVGFVVGGVGVAAGVALLALSPSVPPKTSGASVRPFVGLGVAGVRGAF